MQPQPLGRKVLSNDGHGQVAAVASTEAFRQVVAQETGRVGPPSHLLEQRLPLGVRPTVAVPVGTAVLPSVVEEPDVVVLALQGLDLSLDEGIEFVEQGLDFLWDIEVHIDLSCRVGAGSGQPRQILGPVGSRDESAAVIAVLSATSCPIQCPRIRSGAWIDGVAFRAGQSGT